MKKISGVYKITNNITGDFYIGSSKNIKQRWAAEKSPSTWSTFPGMKLYQAIINYGLENFEFEIIEETTSLHEREQYYIDLLQPSYNNYRASGQDVERKNEYLQSDKCKCSHRKANKKYYNRLCLYEGEHLTLGALKSRFQKQGIPHPTLEAKKYLLEE